MDKNQKALACLCGVLVSFIVAALFKYVFHWGVTPVVVICALANLYCFAIPQRLDSYAPAGLRMFVFILAAIAAFVFGLMFMSWTLLIIYMVAVVAVTILGIATA
jgi:hypothetical protein